jgi:flavin-dependent dehydrogenase
VLAPQKDRSSSLAGFSSATEMARYDVVIVGGGPAGSMAALILSRAGKRVLVLEKNRFPRAKVCGNSLNPRNWSLWQRHGLTERFDRLPHFDIGGFTLERKGLPILRHCFCRPGARTVERGTLDAWLTDEARISGATFQFGVTVQGLTATHLQTSAGEIEAPLVIGADGRNSVIGRLSQLARPSGPCGRIGWQAFIDLPSLDDHIHMNVFPEGYYGLNRISATQTTITLVLFAASKATPEQIMARYLPQVAPTTWKSLHPISRKPWDVTNGRCWLVGDAAHVLEPLTGEGIYSALATAEMAARHILSIERVGVKKAARRYRRQHARFYGARMMMHSLLGWSLADSRRSMRLMQILNYWPAAAAQMVEWVQCAENRLLQEG